MVTSASVAPGSDARRAVLLVSTLSSFLNPFAGSSVGIALPTISRDLGMDAVSLGWVSTSYLLVSAMFLVPFGRLADIYGRKRLFLIGMTIFSIAYLLSGFAPSGTF